MRAGKGRVTIAAGFVTIAAIATPAWAAQERYFSFNIPAGSLDVALRRYARTTGLQLLYRGDTVRGLRTRGVTGNLTAPDALSRLLSGTTLIVSRPTPKTVVIQVGSNSVSEATRPAPAAQTETADADTSQEIVVTGTNIRGTSTTSATRISRREIQRSAKATVGEIITSQATNFGGTGSPVVALTGVDRTGLNDTLSIAPNLRGLGSEATLTLINGRRVAGSGGRGDFTDLSVLPTLGVERVEILTDGASAIYGSDAVAGVVNVIMREDLKSIELRVRGSTGTQSGEHRLLASAALGTRWSGGSVGLIYEFGHDDALNAADRPYTATGDLRPFGGTDRRTFLSSPATILTLDPTGSAYIPAFAVPKGGASSVAQLRPGTNLSFPLQAIDLTPLSDRHIVYGYLNQQIGAVEFHLDGRFASRTFTNLGSPQSTIFAITAANPYFLSTDGGPFSVIGYSFENELENSRTRGRVQALSSTAALTWRTGRWSVDGYATYAQERSSSRLSGLVNASLLNEALGTTPDDPQTAYSAARDGYFNPYGDGSANNAVILNFVSQGFSAQERKTAIIEGGVKADGPLLSIFGMEIVGALGGSVRSERFRRTGENFFSGSAPSPAIVKRGERTIPAAFAELNVPLAGGKNGGTRDPGLRLSLAGRYERYPDFGSTANPKIGIAWRPTPALQLHGSWGTSFRAPALTDLKDPFRVSVTQLPNAAGAFAPVLLLSGGNPSLRPETARTWNVGMILTPPPIPSLRIEANIFRTRFSQRIGQPVLQDVLTALTNPEVASFIEPISPASSAADLARVKALLALPGTIGAGIFPDTAYTAIVDARSVNTSTLTVSGLDTTMQLARPVGAGQLDLGLSATWLFSYRRQLTPSARPLERIDRLGFPTSLRANGTLSYTLGPVSAAIIGRYVGGYTDDTARPARPIRDWFTTDATIGFAPQHGRLAGVSLSLIVENLFDRSPPFVDQSSGLGFDGANANPFGRTVALQLNMKL